MNKKEQFISTIKNIFKKIFTRSNILIFSLIILSLSSTFISGIFSQEVNIEKTAEYISQVIDESVPTKDLLSIAVEREDDGSLPDDEHEFRQLYGVFRQEKITFATGYNMTKESVITLDEIDNNNLSAVYIGSTTGSDEYKGHYKDKTYPVELMFPLARYDSVSMQTAIISESQGARLLQIRRPDFEKVNGSYTEKQFEYLVGEPLEVTINGDKHNFVIQDIFYEGTFYITGLEHTVGNFFFTSYYFPKTVKRQNLYFMCTYPYENSYFMKYINTVYGEGNYKLKCVTNTFSKHIDQNKIVGFYPGNYTSRQIAQTIFVIIAFATFGMVIYLIISRRHSLSLSFIISYLIFSFVPYLLFFVLYKITNETLIFSGIGCKFNALFMLINFAFCLTFYAIFNIDILGLKVRRDKFYEIHI